MAMSKSYEEVDYDAAVQQGKQTLPVPKRKEADIYDLHREALQAFHQAWQIAKEELDRISKELYDFLTVNLQDPTEPSPAPPMDQGNGQASTQRSVPGMQLYNR